MRIFLVRHGRSESNEDWGVNKRVADHAIELTKEGKEQARAAGEFLAKYFEKKMVHGKRDSFSGLQFPRTRLWLSPYRRTRQTAEEIEKTCTVSEKISIPMPDNRWGDLTCAIKQKGDSYFSDKKEHLLLAEQQFGIFDGLSDAEREEKYPEMQAYYEKCKAFEGKLWPKMPLGESRFEVAQRVHQAFGTFHRDVVHGIKNIVIVGHGTTNRAFTMMWLHLPYEWMHEEPNPPNCSIRLIEDDKDRGYIFKGFEDGRHEGSEL
jgi:2,3-bisphosphoglycerate-dependent phosphoglycerate mutase